MNILKVIAWIEIIAGTYLISNIFVLVSMYVIFILGMSYARFLNDKYEKGEKNEQN